MSSAPRPNCPVCGEAFSTCEARSCTTNHCRCNLREVVLAMLRMLQKPETPKVIRAGCPLCGLVSPEITGGADTVEKWCTEHTSKCSVVGWMKQVERGIEGRLAQVEKKVAEQGAHVSSTLGKAGAAVGGGDVLDAFAKSLTHEVFSSSSTISTSELESYRSRVVAILREYRTPGQPDLESAPFEAVLYELMERYQHQQVLLAGAVDIIAEAAKTGVLRIEADAWQKLEKYVQALRGIEKDPWGPRDRVVVPEACPVCKGLHVPCAACQARTVEEAAKQSLVGAGTVGQAVCTGGMAAALTAFSHSMQVIRVGRVWLDPDGKTWWMDAGWSLQSVNPSGARMTVTSIRYMLSITESWYGWSYWQLAVLSVFHHTLVGDCFETAAGRYTMLRYAESELWEAQHNGHTVTMLPENEMKKCTAVKPVGSMVWVKCDGGSAGAVVTPRSETALRNSSLRAEAAPAWAVVSKGALRYDYAKVSAGHYPDAALWGTPFWEDLFPKWVAIKAMR